MPELLWAPWRMSYVERPGTGSKDAANIFVDLPAENEDRKNLILFRCETAFVILNAYPYTNGHLMIAPYKQTTDLAGLDDEELLEINKLLARSIGWIKRAYNPDGFNLGVNLGSAAGAGIPTHIHWHVVPRWGGDTNFITTVGDVRVMPEDLLSSYDRLSSAIADD